MAKVTKTYYYRRRGAYRKFLRRYTRKFNKPLYNRIKNNYMTARFQFNFLMYPQVTSGLYYLQYIDIQNTVGEQAFDLMDKINSNPDYNPYINLFNETKLLGVSIKAVPVNSMTTVNKNPISFSYSFREEGLPAHAQYFLLNPAGVTQRYLKNMCPKWVPADQSVGTINKGKDMTFYVATHSTSSVTDGSNPRWNIIFTVYMKFRKNLTF